MQSIEAKNPGRPHVTNRQGLYSKLARHAELSIDTLVDLMRNSKNENIRLGAARTLLDKILPDLKAVQAQIDEGKELKITVVAGNGFIPPNITLP